jgi:hypothetical protein
MGDVDTLENTAVRAPVVYHRDGAGLVHACHRTIAGPGKYLVWTDCLRDVPPDESFAPTGPAPTVTCPRCRESEQGGIWGIPRSLLPSSLYR